MTTLLHLLANPRHFDRLLGRQLDALRSRGYTVVTASAPGERSKAYAGNPIAHHSLSALSPEADIVADVRAASKIQALFREVRPDIIHTHDPRMKTAARMLSRRAGIPIIVNSVHGSSESAPQTLAHRVALTQLARFGPDQCDAELVPDFATSHELQSSGVPSERIHFIGRGISLDAVTPNRASARAARCLRLQLGVPQGALVVTVVGDLLWEEGYGEFFDAVETLRASRRPHEVAFVVAGEQSSGPGAVDAEVVSRMSARHGVHFVSNVIDSRTLLAMTDVSVVPSMHSVPSTSSMMAGAMGVPVVAIDLPANRSVVEHQRTGLLVRPQKPQHLALAIERLLENRPFRADLGRAARATAVEKFDEQRVVERTAKVYKQLLQGEGIAVPEHRIDLDQPWYADSIDLVDRLGSVADRSTVT